MFLEPVNSSDKIKFTDIDSIPGSSDKVLAVGVWEDSSNSKKVIYVTKIKDQGETYEILYAFSLDGVYALTSTPTPKIMYEGSKYLITFKDPDSNNIFMIQ